MTGPSERFVKQTPASAAFERRDTPLGRSMVHEDYSGSCTRGALVAYGEYVDLCDRVRCRNCPSCLRSRRFLWQMRAEAETLTSHRTFFLTGTWKQQTWDIEECKRETSLFLMRLRSRCHERDTNYRYLIVPERHKSGAFHVHALIHAKDDRLKYREIADSWQAGFFNIKECDFKTAGYVTKYTSKDLFEEVDGKRPRIRASRNPTYGGWVMQKDKELLKQMMADKETEPIWETWQKNLKMMVRETEKKQSPEQKILQLMATNQ